MAIILGEEIQVSMQAGEDEIICVFKPWDQMQDEIKQLCTSRVRIRGRRRPDIDVHGPRIKFFDRNCIRIKDGGILERDDEGNLVSLDCAKDGWQAKVPYQIKSTAAAYFEEGEALSTEESANL